MLCAGFALALSAPSRAEARVIWVVSGAGYGHGVGMSQYGAYGFARRGASYDQILAHYYRGTTLGTTGTQAVRVLLRSRLRRARFRGVAGACGTSLNPAKTYQATRKGRSVLLRNPAGRPIRNCGRALTTSGGRMKLKGKGAFRGALKLKATRRGLTALNVVDIESYVRGVVAEESPSSWPLEALKAQAVAARSYAIATRRERGFHHYDDTRSQVYRGIRAETARTNRAVAETALQVVLYEGEVAETYFSSTSGGHTENNENSFLGGTPVPYLRGVPDPYDSASPHHRWKRKFSQRRVQSRLGRYVRGRLKRIAVISRGVSPRIVRARLIGTGGSRTVCGPTLRARLGLPDTWAYFHKRRR
jgi:stage II sporulation protein D